MRCSFIMPAFKGKHLSEAIASILCQECADFELIIVDDCSPDNIEEIVNSFSDDRIRYYRNEINIGSKNLVEQWNKCLSLAKGEFVVLAPDDDIYNPQYLEKMLKIADEYPNVNAFRCKINLFNSKCENLNYDLFLPEYCDQLTFLYYFYKRYISTGIGQWMFRRKTLVDTGGFWQAPKAWFSDDGTVVKMSCNGVGNCNELLFSMRVDGESISSTGMSKSLLVEKLRASELFYDFFYQWCQKTKANYTDGISTDTVWRVFRNFWISHVLYLIDSSGFKTRLGALSEIMRLRQLRKRTILKHII